MRDDDIERRLARARADVARARIRLEQARRAYLDPNGGAAARDAYYRALDAIGNAANELALARGEMHIAGRSWDVLHALHR